MMIFHCYVSSPEGRHVARAISRRTTDIDILSIDDSGLRNGSEKSGWPLTWKDRNYYNSFKIFKSQSRKHTIRTVATHSACTVSSTQLKARSNANHAQPRTSRTRIIWLLCLKSPGSIGNPFWIHPSRLVSTSFLLGRQAHGRRLDWWRLDRRRLDEGRPRLLKHAEPLKEYWWSMIQCGEVCPQQPRSITRGITTKSQNGFVWKCWLCTPINPVWLIADHDPVLKNG